jgi:hypothetical protein
MSAVNPTVVITPPPGVRVVAPPPPPAGPDYPLTDRFHAYACGVCNASGSIGAEAFVGHVADAVAEDAPVIEWDLKQPQLAEGQQRVLDGKRDLLVELLNDRTDDAVTAVVSVLRVLARQAPAVDHVITAEKQRRRDAAQARPTIGIALLNSTRRQS